MRNPKRIKRILSLLEEVWSKNPDLRLGQLIICLTRWPDEDPFYVEDDVLEWRLQLVKATGSMKFHDGSEERARAGLYKPGRNPLNEE